MMCVTPYIHPVHKILCPCRKCLPCTINRKRTWTTRAIFELMAHKFSTFLTLTYDDDHNPVSLQSQDLTLFWKRCRKYLSKFGLKFRYFACGEYGEKSFRPHYHAIIYGIDSAIFERVALKFWHDDKGKSLGYVYSVPATPETAGYVAGYVTKKMASRQKLFELGLEPEFIRCSRGIGIFLLPFLKELALVQGALDVIHHVKIDDKLVPLPDYMRRKLREMVYDENYREYLKLCRIADMQDIPKGLVNHYLDKPYYDNFDDIREAVKKHTSVDYQNLVAKDKIWNSRSKI